MSLALVEAEQPVDVSYYDQRYFYFDGKFLRPVSGFVRTLMRDHLETFLTEEFRDKITLSWVAHAYKSGNPSVQEFAFKEYALQQICRSPSRFIEDLGSTKKCNLVWLDGDCPFELNTRGLTMFRPKRYNVQYVDAVLRYVVPPRAGGGIRLYAIQASLQTPRKQRYSLKYFSALGMNTAPSDKYLRRKEVVTRYLLWLRDRQKIGRISFPAIDTESVEFQQVYKHVPLGSG
jgi:hypothetical protein